MCMYGITISAPILIMVVGHPSRQDINSDLFEPNVTKNIDQYNGAANESAPSEPRP